MGIAPTMEVEIYRQRLATMICTLFTGHPSEEGNFYALFL